MMENSYSRIKLQLQEELEYLEQYKVTNKRLEVEVKTNDLLKSIRDDENCRLKNKKIDSLN